MKTYRLQLICVKKLDICNNNSTTKQLCDKNFIDSDSTPETEDKIDECNEGLQQYAA